MVPLRKPIFMAKRNYEPKTVINFKCKTNFEIFKTFVLKNL